MEYEIFLFYICKKIIHKYSVNGCQNVVSRKYVHEKHVRVYYPVYELGVNND